jgi:hypothetical protein
MIIMVWCDVSRKVRMKDDSQRNIIIEIFIGLTLRELYRAWRQTNTVCKTRQWFGSSQGVIYERLDKQWPISHLRTNFQYVDDQPSGCSFYSIYLLYNNCLRAILAIAVYFLAEQETKKKNTGKVLPAVGYIFCNIRKCIFTDNGAERNRPEFR